MLALVIGIASGLIGTLYYQSQFPNSVFAKEPYAKVTIEGLKDFYKVGEPIDFNVKLEGYGCPSGFPDVWIERSSPDGTQADVVWSRIGEIRLLPAGYSCPDTEVYEVRHIGDLERYDRDQQERMRTNGSIPIIMDREGTYVVQVTYGEHAVTQFDVTAADH